MFLIKGIKRSGRCVGCRKGRGKQPGRKLSVKRKKSRPVFPGGRRFIFNVYPKSGILQLLGNVGALRGFAVRLIGISVIIIGIIL